jgi:site-specific recombinase XerD
MAAFGFPFNHVRILFRRRGSFLYCRITVNKIRCNADFSINEKVDPHTWDAKRQMVKGATPEAALLNNRLAAVRLQIRNYEAELSAKSRPVSANILKSLYLGEKKMVHTLIETSLMHLDYLKLQPSDEIAQGTVKGYQSRHQNMTNFLKARQLTHIGCEEFTPTLARDFLQWMRNEKSPPSGQDHAAKNLELIRKVIKFSINQEWTKYNPLQAFVIKKGKRRMPPYLSDEERFRLESKIFRIDRIQRIKDCFVFSCHTGLGYADIRALRASEHIIEEDGRRWLDMSRLKTGIDFFVPLTRVATEILHRYGGEKLPIPSNGKFNAYLKEVQDFCEISTTLTVRVARTTFGVVMLNDMNLDLKSVSMMLGHANVSITERHYTTVLKKKIIRNLVDRNPTLYEHL